MDETTLTAIAKAGAGWLTERQLAALVAEVRRARAACARQSHEIEQVLGKALGYPLFGPEMSPDGVPDGFVCVGEHVAESLADEAAARIGALTCERDALRAEVARLEAELAMVSGVLVWLARDLAEQKAAVLFPALTRWSE